MVPHPDSSGRVFLSSQEGKIFLASMPRRGSGVALRVDNGRAHPFLDLTDRMLGLLGIAFHPDFATNGRFFVSYSCDCSTSPGCSAVRCWVAAPGNSSLSCRYQLIVAEFSAKGSPNYSKILFRPSGSDGYLYLITGHGDFSKNGRSFLGKILRFDVDRMLKGGSHGTPKMGKPEIFSMGVNNPSGCSFDVDRPLHLYCADVDKHYQERVYLITNGGNHGSPSKADASLFINHGHPMDGSMPSIVGGLMYRGSADPSLYGRYGDILHSTSAMTANK
ncbi:hypothetical protein HU200_003312 [Digitaria exilis]|uniref:Glucose/Sorbosone dehydrogenase domain-containing protein n=1 Tax=Digitaria exilis TaxID=1010633 RepID=A0A835FXV9_9POAL|nr:hypothetical protein HU200_003312 [Digitaria exilis]